jgi:hypothetical protein
MRIVSRLVGGKENGQASMEMVVLNKHICATTCIMRVGMEGHLNMHTLLKRGKRKEDSPLGFRIK